MARSIRMSATPRSVGFGGPSPRTCARIRHTFAVDARLLAPPPLGVFSYDVLSEVGYAQSISGAPQKDWYHGSARKPALKALQTDFVWGMPFLANPIATAK